MRIDDYDSKGHWKKVVKEEREGVRQRLRDGFIDTAFKPDGQATRKQFRRVHLLNWGDRLFAKAAANAAEDAVAAAEAAAAPDADVSMDEASTGTLASLPDDFEFDDKLSEFDPQSIPDWAVDSGMDESVSLSATQTAALQRAREQAQIQQVIQDQQHTTLDEAPTSSSQEQAMIQRMPPPPVAQCSACLAAPPPVRDPFAPAASLLVARRPAAPPPIARRPTAPPVARPRGRRPSSPAVEGTVTNADPAQAMSGGTAMKAPLVPAPVHAAPAPRRRLSNCLRWLSCSQRRRDAT